MFVVTCSAEEEDTSIAVLLIIVLLFVQFAEMLIKLCYGSVCSSSCGGRCYQSVDTVRQVVQFCG